MVKPLSKGAESASPASMVRLPLRQMCTMGRLSKLAPASFFMGCTPPDRDVSKAAPNHSPRFYVDEQRLKLGVKTLSALALDWLAANG